jgi:2-oxoglutarate dehydrogenase E2 component (dihydrolipoamide succinyltransferase)
VEGGCTLFDVEMPQLGESVTEGTVTKWYKNVGELVKVDEVLFDVSTDKVDTEVPSPATGILDKILIQEGETVDVGTVLAVIAPTNSESHSVDIESSTVGSKTDNLLLPSEVSSQANVATESKDSSEAVNKNSSTDEKDQNLTSLNVTNALKLNMPVDGVEAVPPPPPPPQPVDIGSLEQSYRTSSESSSKYIASPIVRNLMKDNGVLLQDVEATGFGNRVTVDDVKRAIEERSIQRISDVSTSNTVKDNVAILTTDQNLSVKKTSRDDTMSNNLKLTDRQANYPGTNGEDEYIEFNNIRRITAEHMIQSKHTAPHSSIIAEVDFELVEKAKSSFADHHLIGQDVHLTYLPFVARATIEALKLYPNLNASVTEDGLVIHKHINLGFGVDLDSNGLIVPVIHDADRLSVIGLGAAIFDLAYRARNKKLSVDELVGGTFTITNTGPYHTLLTLPIINQPEVGILATDSIKRRPVVLSNNGEELIGIHSTGLIGITFDHRAVDGAYSARFISTVAEIIATHDWVGEL